jgi:[acyl-carrier-protein] S-malonyltransferase
MREALAQVRVQAPRVPLVANVTAMPVREPAQIVQCLVEQVTGTVRWRESIVYVVSQGVDRLVEVGAGKVLTGLARRIAKGATAIAVEKPDDVVAFRAARGA